AANGSSISMTSGSFATVDAQTRMTLQEELVRIWEASRVTVLFVTHSVEEAVFLGTRVVVLTERPGRVKRSIAVDIPRERRNWATLNADPSFITLRDEVLHLVRDTAPA
ncbi:MAG: ABC transporter ATP-binding protein, partial [Pseudomonadota bacterium]